MTLRGLRMAFASETDEGRRFSPAQVKWLTGSDTLVGRHPYDKHEIYFEPTHTLFLQTNHRPHTSLSDDFAFWERMSLIEFTLSFVNREPKAENERRGDPGLKEKLLQHKSGILAWMVKGCLEWQRHGLKQPDKVEASTQEYRKSENFLDSFLEDRCIIGDPAIMSTKAAEIYDDYVDWNKRNNGENAWTASSTKFGTLMGKKFERRKSSGIMKYLGVGLLADREGE
jgi:putative DNA primase/helicase